MEWLYDKKKYDREQWSCSYCKKRKLVNKRNCGNNYPDAGFQIRIPVLGVLTRCPISAIHRPSYNLFLMVKECNNIGMGGGIIRPSLFYSEANYYFEARTVVNEVSGEFDEIRESKERTKKPSGK